MNTTPKPEVLEYGCEAAYNNIISCIAKNDLKPGKKLNAECEVISRHFVHFSSNFLPRIKFLNWDNALKPAED